MKYFYHQKLECKTANSSLWALFKNESECLVGTYFAFDISNSNVKSILSLPMVQLVKCNGC